MYTYNKFLGQIEKLPYATIYNFQPWIAKTAKDLKSSLQQPTKYFKRANDTGLINKVGVYPTYEGQRFYKHNTFYRYKDLFEKATFKNKASSKINYFGELSYRMLEHESAISDVLLAFLNLYSDYDIEFIFNKRFEYGVEKYNYSLHKEEIQRKGYFPDVVIKMTNSDNKTYHFIVEIERTRSGWALVSEKFEVINKLEHITRYGLSRNTKFLFVFLHEKYNSFWRPIQYDNDQISPYIKRYKGLNNIKLNGIIKRYHKEMKPHYLLMDFANFYKLNETVWLKPDGNKVKIIG